MKKADRIISLGLIGFFALVYLFSLGFPQKAARYPKLLAVAGVLVAVILLIKTYRQSSNGEVQENEGEKIEVQESKEGKVELQESKEDKGTEPPDSKKTKTMIMTLVITLIYVLLLPVLGFMISTFLFLTITMWRLDPDKKIKLNYIIISLVITVGMFFLFRNFLNVLLPEGILF